LKRQLKVVFVRYCFYPFQNPGKLKPELYIQDTVHDSDALPLPCKQELNSAKHEQSYALLKAFFNSGRDYQVLLSVDLSIVAFNNYAACFTETYLGMQLHEGTGLLAFMGKPFAKDFKALSDSALAGETMEYEHFISSKTNERLWFKFTMTPVYDCMNTIIGISLMGVNISEQKKQEKTIRSQSDTLSVIAQLQSHQVRQPVTSILGIMSLIKAENYEPRKEYLIYLEQATRQLDEVIQTIVAQSRS
jgi:hypothetical protein